MRQRLPIGIYFPAGVIAAVSQAARKHGLSEQWTFFVLWQMQKRLQRSIIETQGKLQPEHHVIPMNSVILQTRSRRYAAHLRAMTAENIIELVVDHDSRIHKSRQYRYAERFDVLGKQERYELFRPTVLNAMLRHRHPVRSGHDQDDQKYFEARLDYLKQFDFDHNRAVEWVERLRDEQHELGRDHEFNLMRHNIDLMAGGHRVLIKDIFGGREHHPFLWVSREIRQNCVTYLGQKTVQLDLPAAQPLLLYIALQCRGPHKIEVRKLREALQIDFYLHLAGVWKEMFDGEVLTRNQVKRELWCLLFGPTRHELPIFQVFRQGFPDLYEAIGRLKSESHEEKPHAIIARMLQTEESNLIFKICQQLTDEHLTPFFTIHDCIAVVPEHCGRTEQIMLNALRERGVDWPVKLRE